MSYKYINRSISKKMNSDSKIINVYSSEYFAKFYQDHTFTNSFNNDLDFYKSILNTEDFIIELASGTGRILIPLLQEGYNIRGIESEISMIEVMPSKYHKYVEHSNVFDFASNEKFYTQADCFIIPATSISIFPLKTIENFLFSLTKKNKKFNIIFDIINMDSLVTDKPKKEKSEHGTFYYINYIQSGFIVYNLYNVETNTLGYSKKFSHTIEQLLDIFENTGCKLEILKEYDNYFILKGSYDFE